MAGIQLLSSMSFTILTQGDQFGLVRITKNYLQAEKLVGHVNLFMKYHNLQMDHLQCIVHITLEKESSHLTSHI